VGQQLTDILLPGRLESTEIQALMASMDFECDDAYFAKLM
jgi:hypothetical protein